MTKSKDTRKPRKGSGKTQRKRKVDKFRIVSIEKRSRLARFFSINHWRVSVEYRGEVHTFNAWAGCDEPTVDSLIYSISRYLSSLDRKSLIASITEKNEYEIRG